MNEEALTHEVGVGFPIDTWISESLGGKEPPPRGSLLVSLNHYAFIAQGAHLLLLTEDKNTAFCLRYRVFIVTRSHRPKSSLFKTNTALFI